MLRNILNILLKKFGYDTIYLKLIIMFEESKMFGLDGKYGSAHIDGMSIDIDKAKVSDLNEYLKELETKRMQLLEQQNSYLSQIINL